MIQIREYTDDDYPTIAGFWEKRDAVAPEARALPRVGYLAVCGEEILACGFSYLDACGTGVAWLGWFATNPDVHGLRAGRGLRHVINNLEGVLTSLDYSVVVAATSQQSFARYLESRGYLTGDTGMTYLTKNLQ